MMKRSKVIGFAILAAAVGGALLVMSRGSSRDAHPRAPAAALSPPHLRRSPFTIPQLYAEGQAKAGGQAVKPDGSKIEPSASTTEIDDVVAGVLDSDPQLRKFHELRKKALRTAAEQQDYLAMISNPKLIEDARKDLLAAASQSDLDQDEEIKRLQRIEFLNSALAWDDNPARAKALEVVGEVVGADVSPGVPSSVAGSVLGDKFDLFQLLMASDPDQAKALLAKSHGTASEKILLLAAKTSGDTNNQTP